VKSDDFVTYKVPLGKLYPNKICYDKNTRNSLEDIIKMQWTFGDREKRTLYSDNISVGIEP